MNNILNNGVCPHCGYCPTCGRRNEMIWYNPWYNNYPQYWCSGIGSSQNQDLNMQTNQQNIDLTKCNH